MGDERERERERERESRRVVERESVCLLQTKRRCVLVSRQPAHLDAAVSQQAGHGKDPASAASWHGGGEIFHPSRHHAWKRREMRGR